MPQSRIKMRMELISIKTQQKLVAMIRKKRLNLNLRNQITRLQLILKHLQAFTQSFPRILMKSDTKRNVKSMTQHM